MATQKKKLQLIEIEGIVREMIKGKSDFVAILDEDKDRLTIGTSIKSDVARCMVYIPGDRPELGQIVAVYDIDRHTGNASIVREADW